MTKQYQYDYPRPALTVDALVVTVKDAQIQVLLIQRKQPPFQHRWALPGGFVNEGERLLEAAHRELHEETGVVLKHLVPFGTYGDPGRDPRGWTVTVAYLGIASWNETNAHAGNDAASLQWFPINQLPQLAFDHDGIITDGLLFLRRQVWGTIEQLPHELSKDDLALLRHLLL